MPLTRKDKTMTTKKEAIVKDKATEGENMDVNALDHSQTPEERQIAKHPELEGLPVDSWPEHLKPAPRPVPPEQNGEMEVVGSKVSPKKQSDQTASGRIPNSGVEDGEQEEVFHAIPGEGGVFETLPNGRTRRV